MAKVAPSPPAPQIGALQRALAELSERLGEGERVAGAVVQPAQHVVQQLAALAESAVNPMARLVEAQREWADQMAAWADLQRQLADRIAAWAEIQREVANVFDAWLAPAGVVTRAGRRALHTLAGQAGDGAAGGAEPASGAR